MTHMSENSPNPYDASHSDAASSKPSKYVNYMDVPWYRRSGVNSAFTLLGLFCFSPLLWFVCAILMTGDIYYNKHQDDGSLKTWSFANKVIAWVLVLVNLVVWGYILLGTAVS